MWSLRHRPYPYAIAVQDVAAAVPSEIVLTDNQERALDAMCGTANAYIYGPPGSGKTTLLDAVHAVDQSSLRWHCAEFFRALHAEIPAHDHSLPATFAALTGGAGLICFDEFHIHDVADAIYIDRALRWWTDRGTRVVATSNYHPSDLLPNPLLHSAAEPVIDQIKRNFAVCALDDGVDHRSEHHLTPADGFAAGTWTLAAFRGNETAEQLSESIRINGRELGVVSKEGPPPSYSGVCTTFAELCVLPWSSSDYFALLEDIERLTVLSTPDPATMEREPAQRFTNLVDAACDRNVRLDVESVGPPGALRLADHPPLDVDRTVSRLTQLTLV